METQTVEKVKPDSLNLSAKTVVGSGNDITHWNDSPVFMTGFFTSLLAVPSAEMRKLCSNMQHRWKQPARGL